MSRRLEIDEVWDSEGNLLERVEVWRNPTPLDPVGALATLLAVTGALEVSDAANAVQLRPEDLINEAEAWADFVQDPQ